VQDTVHDEAPQGGHGAGYHAHGGRPLGKACADSLVAALGAAGVEVGSMVLPKPLPWPEAGQGRPGKAKPRPWQRGEAWNGAFGRRQRLKAASAG
jgi:hypothetical protein